MWISQRIEGYLQGNQRQRIDISCLLMRTHETPRKLSIGGQVNSHVEYNSISAIPKRLYVPLTQTPQKRILRPIERLSGFRCDFSLLKRVV